MYSKSDILKMILENEHNTTTLEKIGPKISTNEAIHGTLNFVLKKELRNNNGDSPKAK